MGSEAFLESLIERSPYCMWISDDKGSLVRINQACRDLFQIQDEVDRSGRVLQKRKDSCR